MLRIALMGDLHFPQISAEDAELKDAKDKFFTSYLQAFFSIESHLYVSIGDLTHQGLEEEFSEVYRSVRGGGPEAASFRQVLGNHDVLAVTKDKLVPHIGKPLYDMLETDEAVIVLLDTTKELELHGWGLDAEQSRWLQQCMRVSPEKPMLIFAHHPVPDTTLSSPAGDALFAEYQDIRPLLAQRSGPGIYFNGHTHSHSIVNKGSWYYVQTAAAICTPCFRVIELTGRSVRIETMVMNDEVLESGRKVLYEKLRDYHRPKELMLSESDLSLSANLV